MREWMSEPEDDRPVIGHCAVCGCDIHDSSDGYYADTYYEIFSELICEDHIVDYCNRNFRKGD